jgi:hypothetical protein
MRFAGFRFLPVVILALSVGCGGGDDSTPDLVEVTGTVMMGGKPLEKALVVFVPEAGGMSNGETDASGKFSLMYRGQMKGAAPGKCIVKVSKSDGDAGAELIPGIYNSTSIITRDVLSPGPNDFTIDLDKEKAAAKANRDRKPQA